MKEVNRRKFFQASGAAVACAALPAAVSAGTIRDVGIKVAIPKSMVLMDADKGHVSAKRLAHGVMCGVQDIPVDGMHINNMKFVRCTFKGEVSGINGCTFDDCGDVMVRDGGTVENCHFIAPSGARFSVQAL